MSSKCHLVIKYRVSRISHNKGIFDLRESVRKNVAVSMDFGTWDHAEINVEQFAEECYRVLRTGGTAIIWYDFWKLSYQADAFTRAGFKMNRCIINVASEIASVVLPAPPFCATKEMTFISKSPITF